MAAIVYPTTLPGPSVSEVMPAERRLLSDVTAGPLQARGLQRDYLATQRVEWAVLTAGEADAFNAWWRDTLTHGGAWFASTWPAPQGWVSIVRRLIGAPRWAHLPGGFWRVSATVQVRGRGMAPDDYRPTGYVGTSGAAAGAPEGGGGSVGSLAPVSGTQAGDGLVFAILTQNGATVTMPEAFGQIGNVQDSSGGLRLHVYAAYAADVAALVYSVDVGPSAVLLTTYRIVDDQPEFPNLIGAFTGAVEAGPGVNPGGLSRGFSGEKLAIAYAFIETDVVGAAQLGGGDPPGYSPAGIEAFSYYSGRTLQVQLVAAYKEFVGDYENPGSFDDGSGYYGGGGAGAAVALLGYRSE